MSYLGLNKLGKVYLGTTEIAKVYLGTNLVYQKESSSALPYDAEIEYLEATKTQWINTGIIGNQDTRIRTKFMPTATGYMYVHGCRGDNSHSITIGSSGSSSTFNWRFGNQTQTKATSVGIVYDVVQDKNKARVNGTETTYGTVSDFTTPDSIYLMWASGDTASYNYQGRIYFMKILNGDILVRDFIPVRVGQTGYMYDKVSGQLFGNQGSGNFMLGHDKMPDNITPVEYLQATGTQYIDTGLSPTTNSHVIIECSNVLNASLENESFGYGVSGGQRFHMVAVANWNSNKFHAGCGTDVIYTTTADTASHTFELYGNGTFVQDGTSYSIGSSVGTISDTMPLFARLWNGSYQYSNGVRIHSFKWYESETLVLDLIPVRVEQTGYMYDKVSGQLFGNLGTNLFTLGDDKIDTDGLIGYWNCEDAAVNGNWVDRINSFQLQLGGTAAKTSDGYRFNNLSSPRNAYALFNYNSNSTLNSLVDKTFTCIVYCSIKFTATNKTASIIDFGSLGSAFSGISILASAGQNGNVRGNFKVDGNSNSGWEERNNSIAGDAIPTDEYVNYPIKLGTRILDNGKQEAFFEANGVRANAIKTTPIKVNFSGCAASGTSSCAFGLGITYLSGQSVTQYASNYLCDIYYRKILLYNKPK